MMQKIFSYKYLFLGLLISVLIPIANINAQSTGSGSVQISVPANFSTPAEISITVNGTYFNGTTNVNVSSVPILLQLNPASSPPTPTGTISSSPTTCTSPCSPTVSVTSTNVANPPNVVKVYKNNVFLWNLTGNTSSSATDWGLTAGTYQYCLRAVKSDWTETANLACFTTTVSPAVATPATPTGFWAGASPVCGSGQINLSWNASSGATSYTLRRDGTTIYTGANLSFSDTGLVAGSNHTYTVSASNSSGTSATASASANAPTACAISVPVVTFTANPTSMTLPTNSVTLNWSASNSPTGCTAASNPVNASWNGSKSVTGPQTISGLTVGSKIFTLYCTNSGGNSTVISQTVSVINAGAPNPDLKGTVWTDANRNVVWNYNNVDGPVDVYNQAPYRLSWAAVSNATSCTLDGSSVSVSGGTVNTYIANTPSKTHTLSCTGAGGTTANTFIITMPPAPTNPVGTCPTPYTNASLSWTAPAGYNTFYVRLNNGGYTWPPTIATEVVGTTWVPATTPGQTYTWWVSTKNTSNGAWSPDVVSYNLVCNNSTFPLTVTKAGTGTGTVTPSTGTITWSGNTGTANYNSGASVTLTATPSSGATFTGWSGGVCSGTGTCVVSMTQARSVTATFSFVPPPTNLIGTCPSPYTSANLNWTAPAGYNSFYVRLNPGASNYTWPVSAGGIATEVTGTNWKPATTPGQSYTWWISTRDTVNGTYSADAVSYNLNCYGAVTASISAGSTNIPYNTATNITWSSTNANSCSISPTSWTGTSGTQSTGNLTATRTYTVSCNPAGSGSTASVIVNVQAQPKSLTVIKSGQGTITSGPVGISCGSDCTEDYAADSTVVLTATPSSGRIFTGWGGDGASCGRNATCSIIMNSPKSVIANFAVDPNYKEF